MSSKVKTFGTVIHKARKEKGLNLKQCAALIFKENHLPISYQYLNDLEHDRRNPPAKHLLNQFSKLLNIPIEVLYFYSGMLPQNININAEPDKIVDAYRKFADALK